MPATAAGFKSALHQIITAVDRLFKGHVNCVGEITLTAGTTTVLTYPELHSEKGIFFMPKSAAAAALYTSSAFRCAVTQGSATITHASAAGTETYRWAAF
jgi:hypothetical protein